MRLWHVSVCIGIYTSAATEHVYREAGINDQPIIHITAMIVHYLTLRTINAWSSAILLSWEFAQKTRVDTPVYVTHIQYYQTLEKLHGTTDLYAVAILQCTMYHFTFTYIKLRLLSNAVKGSEHAHM